MESFHTPAPRGAKQYVCRCGRQRCFVLGQTCDVSIEREFRRLPRGSRRKRVEALLRARKRLGRLLNRGGTGVAEYLALR